MSSLPSTRSCFAALFGMITFVAFADRLLAQSSDEERAARSLAGVTGRWRTTFYESHEAAEGAAGMLEVRDNGTYRISSFGTTTETFERTTKIPGRVVEEGKYSKRLSVPTAGLTRAFHGSVAAVMCFSATQGRILNGRCGYFSVQYSQESKRETVEWFIVSDIYGYWFKGERAP